MPIKSTLPLFLTALATHLTPAAFAAGEPPKVALPVIPDRAFKLTDYGGVGDGKTLNTAALADTIAAATKAGGGRVVVPAGTFLVGRVVLASRIDLHLDRGATLLLTDDTAAFRTERNTFANCVTAEHCQDVAITGEGTIDGQGEKWWVAFRKIKKTPAQSLPENHRPYMVVLSDCTRVKVDGVTLANSPSFHLVPGGCSDVTIHDVKFKAPADAPNTDALDPSGYRFSITNCLFSTGDDCIAIKASGKGTDGRLSCEDFYVADCTFQRGHGLSIGGQTPGGLRRLTVRNCTFDGTDAGIRMKAGRGSGGLVEDCTYDNITMRNVKVPIFITSYYPTTPEKPAADPAQAVTEKTPIWRNISIRNLTVTDSPEAGRIIGLAEMPVDGITFTNVHITAKKGLTAINAKGLRFEQSTVTATAGPAVLAEHAEISGLPAAASR